jgi:anti-sigma factor ChrR (cupin superfamily)
MDINKIPWSSLRDGTAHKLLAKNSKIGFQVDIIKLDADKTFNEHIHDDVEWVYILKGSFTDHRGTFKEGDFVINEKGSRHSTVTGPNGCELLCFWSGSVS